MTEGSRSSTKSAMKVVMKRGMRCWLLQNTNLAMSDFYGLKTYDFH